MSRIAIVAALEREVRALVKDWRVRESEHQGRRFRIFEQPEVVVVCGGVGAEAARRAAEAVIALYAPEIVYSVGFAGALDSALNIADIVRPARVVNANDGSSTILEGGSGTLVSFGAVAGPDQKSKLRESFGAVAVDMESAAVARAAEAHGIGLAAVKVISDTSDFKLPPMDRFVRADGSFSELGFAVFAAARPWTWPQVLRLARNSKKASKSLCTVLRDLVYQQRSSSKVPSAI